MIGFLKMTCCVQTLFFGQLIECNKLIIIFPFYVKIFENCEMFKTSCRNALEGKGKVRYSPPKTHNSVFGLPTFSATGSALEDVLAC